MIKINDKKMMKKNSESVHPKPYDQNEELEEEDDEMGRNRKKQRR